MLQDIELLDSGNILKGRETAEEPSDKFLICFF